MYNILEDNSDVYSVHYLMAVWGICTIPVFNQLQQLNIKRWRPRNSRETKHGWLVVDLALYMDIWDI